MSVFKACDIRGRYGQELNAGMARRLGLAVGENIKSRPILLGGDLRPSTAALKSHLMDGLMTAGCPVIDIGTVPTPTFYFAKDQLQIANGIMVTGSHNPPGDNGFKLSLGPRPITAEEIQALESQIAAQNLTELPASKGGGRLEKRDVIPAYEASLRQRFSGVQPMKVVIDAGNGCYSEIAPRLLRELGHQVVELNCRPDGTFPGRSPNPSVAANLAQLSQLVTKTGARLGAAYDGDGDRAIFVDERGRVVESDRSIVLLARHLLKDGPNKVVYDLKCSSVVAEEVEKAGGIPVMEKSGHAFIRAALLREQAVLGGEISGHFFFGQLGYDDGLYATLLMMQVLAGKEASLATLVDTVPRYPITPDIRLACPPEEAREIVEEMDAAFQECPGCQVNRLDGVRLAWADGWALARVSVTEPVITLRFEAHTQARLLEIQELVRSSVPGLARVWSDLN